MRPRSWCATRAIMELKSGPSASAPVIGIARSNVGADDEPALRLGLRMVKSLGKEAAERIVAARTAAPFASVQDLTLRAALERRELEALADAGALRELSGNRHLTFWQVAASEQELPLAPVPLAPEGTPLLLPPTEGQNIAADYRSAGLTLGRHPLTLLREELAAGHVAHCRGAARTAAWSRGARGRHRDRAPAAAERRWRHVHHAGG